MRAVEAVLVHSNSVLRQAVFSSSPRASSSATIEARAPVWEQVLDEEGDCFWLNRATGESCWERPEAAAGVANAAAGGGGGGAWVEVGEGQERWFRHTGTGEVAWQVPAGRHAL